MASSNYYGYTHGTPYSSGYVATPGVATPAYSGQSNIPTYSTPRTGPSYDQSYVTQSIPAQSYAYPTNRAQAPVAYGTDTSQHYAASGNATNPAYSYANSSTAYTNTYNSVVSNYAASALYSQQTTVTPSETSSQPAYTSLSKQTPWNFRKNLRGNKVKPPTKVQQIHYCEVCKISCAGPQTYKEHIDGQRHKKKEAQAASGTPTAAIKRGPAGVSLRCELCDVSCTGSDAYAAHIRGSKHQKVVKLHTKLGKPIPSTDPVVINQKGVPTRATVSIPQIPASAGKIKVLGTPRINFIGGGRLHTTGMEEKEKVEEETPNSSTQTAPVTPAKPSAPQQPQAVEQSPPTTHLVVEMDKDCLPVGQDYVEEVKGEDGKNTTFFCKLCDCRFNDPNAKEMHLKGRRHRLQYKKKVDPNLMVDIKPSLKHRKLQETKDRRFFHKQTPQNPYWNDYYPMPQGQRYGYDTRHMSPLPPPPPPPHMQMGMMPPAGFGGHGPMMGGGPYRRGPATWDDNHIMQKHSEIIPKEDELDEINHVVMITERALKLVSDKIAEEDSQAAMNEIIRKELGDEIGLSMGGKNIVDVPNDEEASNGQSNEGDKIDDSQNNRILKGLMRVGPLAKSLLLSGDTEVDVAVICAEKPSRQLLQRIGDMLPKHLQSISSAETFEIIMKPDDAGLQVCATSESKIKVNVTITSPLVRESNVTEGAAAEMVKEPKQMLERQKCLDALSALRHTKWYQARVSNLQPCPIIIRLLRDLCRRLPTWAKLNLWAIELLCERIISSAGEPLSPGEAFRHVLEAISSGLLLPGGSGLFDPCEKDPTDALASLSRQEREDITSSAQHALRLIAFRQIHKILGVEPLQKNRKRKHDIEMDDNTDGTNIDGSKKDKLETSNWAEDDTVKSLLGNDGNGLEFVSETTAMDNSDSQQ